MPAKLKPRCAEPSAGVNGFHSSILDLGSALLLYVTCSRVGLHLLSGVMILCVLTSCSTCGLMHARRFVIRALSGHSKSRLIRMESGGSEAAAGKLLRALRRWTRVVGKLLLLPYLRGLWGTLGGYLQNFKGLK